jgi:hypothetical protein
LDNSSSVFGTCDRLEHAVATAAPASDAEFRESSVRRHALHDHDVHGQRDARADPPDQRIVHQAGDEVAGSACDCVGFGPVESLADSLRRIIAMFEEDVGPRIDEELDALLLSRLAHGRRQGGTA